MADTLIVGGGSAGCVLAARLSEDPDHHVRLLEAGPMWTSPDGFPPALRDGTELPLDDASLLWRYPIQLTATTTATTVRGRVIGGSGSINGCYFVRAPAADFAAWSREIGTGGWTYDELLEPLRRLEHDHDFGEQPGHGDAGPIPVRRPATRTPLTDAFVAAAAATGFGEIPDLNAPDAADQGFGAVPANIDRRDGTTLRVGSAQAYLLPALTRPNLTVSADTTALRIRFSGTRAIGVECVRAGTAEFIAADRIVLCAGAIESAALLLRSGIGDPARSRALGIPVVQALPVGRWCTDHPEIGIDYRHDAPHRRGPVLEYVLELGDIEIRPYTMAFTPGIRQFALALMRPHGAGELRLRSADPADPPWIDQRYLEQRLDRDRLREAVRLSAEIMAAMAAAPEEPIPAVVSDEWLTAHLATSQHLSGTCRMGSPADTRAVVDADCRVHGVDGLAVADLAIVPVPLGRGPQATAALIGERAAELLSG
ncbi:mycofactocin dehydrogenase MftG [Nocardia cyriacigeorgica]|uniref:mycofactocin dehydrogenase MftG n=1 Tax=Nocardia cyriacigeorgica TaxID=135487 RepID=UPI000CEA42F8|nr:mycofactocin system GMC family oxidoreductase MftG [Nocardia cyriacigeorgica]AVH22086.1 mycofactocin system GMC family oxidoreductase MftG [Nocardia cyriacigeorgica]MBF6321645.1 mycofactocin system GMC family oxidoreductase MftG [Nocardia cyriacigeorgica]MBF6494678.1 mycofactocin system GMC family oxidoreductase MftG [Nocardia cyriacigeorgica]PPJ11634.1 mycofactocin system GMC family oxidoreductase MftG [Nocardia cyriacigeorgica]